MLGLGALLVVVSFLLVRGAEPPEWELDLFETVNHASIGVFYVPLFLVMQLGNLIAAPALGGVAMGIFRRHALGAAMFVAGVGGWAAARVIKEVVGRGRPPDFVTTRVRGEELVGLGFVSGHTAVAFGLAVVLVHHLPRRWQPLWWVLAAVVGVARVYVGAHLPLDVLGGAAVGIVMGEATNLTWDTWRLRQREGAAGDVARP